MTDDERAKRIHDLTYSCESRTEMCERVVDIEAENAKLREDFHKMDAWYSKELNAYISEDAKLLDFAKRAFSLLTLNEPRHVWKGMLEEARELGVEVEL